jgi:tetratricopeptide (TPR) repeat protein
MTVLVIASILMCSAIRANGQQKPTDDATLSGQAIKLALDGRCAEAMPLLKQAAAGSLEQESKRLVGKAGVRCSMLLSRQDDATIFLNRLLQEFPHDADVLFLAVHVYSDLSQMNSQALMNSAPDSQEVIQLNAENFEKQRDLQKAIAEYRVLLQRAPNMPGIHYRIGGLILAQPGNATSAEDARKEFEEELKTYPQNAGAEYYLGELSRQADNTPEAIEHFSRAAKLYPSFAEAHFGLGRSLLDSDKAADAVAPLETATKLAPENPTIHFTLATAYQRVGRKEDAAREFALRKNVSGRPIE